jgi:hypothetical protein
LGRRGLSFTQGTKWFLGEALKGFGLAGAVAFGLERLGLDRGGQSAHAWLGPDEVQHDEEPNECEQDELINKML